MPVPSPALLKLLEGAMQTFIHNENISLYLKLIAIAEGDPARDEARYQVLLRLLADEVGRSAQLPTGSLLTDP